MSKAILFITSELDGMSLDMYRKVQIEAKIRNKQLLCFCGGPLHNSDGIIHFESQLYNFVNNNLIDGVIFNGGAVGQFSPSRYLEDFVNRFPGMPVVSLSYPITNAVNITVDNYKGIYDLINHLIKDHQYKNIAFVKGPEGHPEAEERFQAYKDALSNNNISFSSNLIAPGDFSSEAGEAAVKRFVDNGIKVDAISCVDDDSALGVFLELKRRNIKCPREIAVTGFDDIITAEKLIPSLTTVAQPYDKMIEESFNAILNRNTSDVVVPTIGVRRESCGCRDKDVLKSSKIKEEVTDFNQTIDILSDYKLPISDSWKSRLLEALEEDLVQEKDFVFNDELSALLEGTRDFTPIHKTLSIFNRYIPINQRSISVMQQARVLVNKISNRICSLDRLEFENQAARMNTLISNITQVDSEEGLFNLIIEGLPEFGSDECHLMKFKDEQAKMIFSFRNGKQGQNYSEKFPTSDLIPTKYLDPNKSYLVIPLVASGIMFGYGIYSLESKNADIINAINTQISGELDRLKLLFIRNREKIQLEERNNAIQNLITPMLDLIKQVTIDSQKEVTEMQDIKAKVEMNNKSFSKTLEMLDLISQKIDNVMRSVTVINDISENVNVLAINTSIQSAHAGDFGKAFGVIAKEIRKLSDSTAQNAKKISDDLSETISEFRNFKNINSSNVETFKGFSTQINHFMDIFNNIASRMETLSSSSLNIIDIMESDD